FGFMPLFFVLYFSARPSLRNALLFASSLLFYYFGAGSVVLVLIGSVIGNHVLARLMERDIAPKACLVVGVVANLLPLALYKYWGFAQQTVVDVATVLGH